MAEMAGEWRRLDIAEFGWTWLEMTGNGLKWPTWLEIAKSSQKWLEITGCG